MESVVDVSFKNSRGGKGGMREGGREGGREGVRKGGREGGREGRLPPNSSSKHSIQLN